MKNPILERGGLRSYGLIWTVICIVHIIILRIYYGLLPIPAFVDGAIFNLLFLSIGIGLWYFIRYGAPLKNNYTGLIYTHLFTAFISISIWIFVSYVILKIIFSTDEIYLLFLNESLPWRGYIGTTYYVILILVYHLIQYYQELEIKASEEQELKTIIKETELKMLKSQINPHFIFNSLNSISSLTISSPERARDMVIKLSDFLRYSINQDESEKNTLREEIQHIQLYLDIEKVRFGDKLIFENAIPKQCQNLSIPKMILQPLFENAIKYGVYESLEPVIIKVVADCQNENLNLTISNNYDSESITKKGEGIGLKNIKQRLSIIYGNAELKTSIKDGVFSVFIQIPQTQ